ncbi:MAG: type II restriction endonuclease [Akkermansiaceae bacterium]|jgi:hypothetical protein|nr:type II restriction endonuclease [Akkermansiaceae bacterium]
MRFGQLSSLFSCFAWKQLTAVEVDPNASNGHEFNSSQRLRDILGDTTRKPSLGNPIPARFVYFSDENDEVVESEGTLSWYDSRANHKTRTEWRLYYTDNSIVGREGKARAGDSIIIAFKEGISSATVFAAPASSTSENQLRWLFGIPENRELTFGTSVVSDTQSVDISRARILEAAGIEIPVEDDTLLSRMLELFGEGFPSTAKFGSFIRSEVSNVTPADGADKAIMSWMEQEEYAFRVLERHVVNKRLESRFSDVDDFISYSLSVHNRRKSRAGLAFENHLSEIFRFFELSFERGVILEAKAKPDFLFPSKRCYYDEGFSNELLTLLGAKTSCKDRWRQVLAEGVNIRDKHLITLQPSISSDQLEQMRSHRLQLVVPEAVQASYPQVERDGLWTLERFITMVQEKQFSGGIHLNS